MDGWVVTALVSGDAGNIEHQTQDAENVLAEVESPCWLYVHSTSMELFYETKMI